jgi:phage tail sheath protein FI
MVNILSPGVYVIEKDISNYPATINSTTVGVVGFSAKGPTNKPTLITSQESLIRTFGEPDENLPGQGIIGALEILEATNSMYFVRVADQTATEASAVLAFGGCPAVAVSAVGIGVGSSLTFTVQVTDENGVPQFNSPKEFTIAAGSYLNQGEAFAETLGQDLDSLKVIGTYEFTENAEGKKVAKTNTVGQNGGSGNFYGYIVGAFAGSGTTLTVSGSLGVFVGVNAYGDINANNGDIAVLSNSVNARGTSLLTGSVAYVVESLYPGTSYNLSSRADGTIIGNSLEVDGIGGNKVILSVNDGGALVESFKPSMVTKGSLLTQLINTTDQNPTSDYIKANIVVSGTSMELTARDDFTQPASAIFENSIGFSGVQGVEGVVYEDLSPRFVKLIGTTKSMSGGSDGNTARYEDDIIGSLYNRTGIYALDDDQLNITIGIVPGLHEPSIQNALITLAETSQNFVACVSPPYGKDSVQEAIDWSNGLSQERKSAINSSYGALYWPWVKTYVPLLKADKWIDPAVYGARQIAFTAGTAELWFAPAGFIRGRLTKPLETQVKLNQGDRDSMYSGGNVVNPIVNFPQQGITIFGQRTTQRDPTALDRVNVRMLLIYIRKVLLLSTQRFAFEPNDSILWSQIVAVVEPLLDDIKRRRGITEFAVICDSTTNTPVRVDRNEVWCKILLKPTKAAEAVVFEINVTAQSAQIAG